MQKILFSIFVITLILLSGCNQPPMGKYDEFAQCLTENGVVVYGAYWCIHCQKVKNSFGDSFKYMNYVECDPNDANGNPELCQQERIGQIPTFIFSDGTRLTGELTHEQLSQKTGCVLPS